jgi:Mg2+ transporter MgtE
MLYLTRLIGKPVVDAVGETIGTISDLAIATGEVFPRVTALAFLGPGKTPFMLSWRKFVAELDEEHVTLNAPRPELRFSYLQPDEVLLARDLLNKQIVDTQGLKIVRVNDLKLSESRNQLRLLGAEVGARGLLRAFSPRFEASVERAIARFGWKLPENLIAWNYMDLIDRDLSRVQLSVTHKRLHELHPADVADLIEQLSPVQRAKVFEHLDNARAAETLSELEDEMQPAVLDAFSEERASSILKEMDPDDAADLIGDLPQDKAEALLRLMGVRESRQIRRLMGYHEKTAGGIMTPEVTMVTEDQTVQQIIDHLRGAAAENESIYYIYTVDAHRKLTGVVSLRDLIVSAPDTAASEIAEREVFSVDVDDDQEDVAEMMSKYDLLALPVLDGAGRIVGIVTVDDALEVMEEESAEDMTLVTGTQNASAAFEVRSWFGASTAWITVWLIFGAGLALVLNGYSSTLSSLLAAALFVPLVMRMSEDVTSHAVAGLIESGDLSVRPKLLKRLAADGAAGLALGLISALVAMLILQLLHADLRPVLAIGAGVAGSILVVVLLSSLFPWIAVKSDGTGWRASRSVITALMGGTGVTLYLAFVALGRAALKM